MTEQIRITKVKRAGDCGVVSITGRDEPLTISIDAVINLQVVENTVITLSQMERLIDEAGLFACNREATRLLSMRQHAVGELRFKLKRKEFHAEHITEAINRLKRQGVLDDDHLALRLSEKLLEQRPCGRAYLISYLQRKHIERDLAERTAEVVLGGQDDIAMAEEALQARWHRLREFELETAQRKAYNYLARRGFGYAASKAAFERLQKSENEGNDH